MVSAYASSKKGETKYMTKAERINRVQNSLDSPVDVIRRLPEVDAIYDEDIRTATINTFFKGCPDYFWERPSSSTGKYHSDDECGTHGNWIHTKRVFAEYVTISESYLEGGLITEEQRESGKAAALLHDMMKYGWPSDNNEHTVNDHDLIAADVAEHIGNCPAEVVSLIETHMGPYGEGPLPSNEREWLFHLADKSASGTPEDSRAVYYPSDEILDEVPDINQIEYDGEEPV